MVVTTRAQSEQPSSPALATRSHKLASPAPATPTPLAGPSRSTRSRTTPQPRTRSTATPARARSRTPRSEVKRGGHESQERDEDDVEVYVELPKINGLDKEAMSLREEDFLPPVPSSASTSRTLGEPPANTDSSQPKKRVISLVDVDASHSIDTATTDGRRTESHRESSVTSARNDLVEPSSSDTFPQDLENGRASSVLDSAVEEGEDNVSSSSSSSGEEESDDDSDSDASSSSSSSTASSSSSRTTISAHNDSTHDLDSLLQQALKTAHEKSSAAMREKEDQERNAFDLDVMELGKEAVKERPIPGLTVPSLPPRLLNIQAARKPGQRDNKGKGKATADEQDVAERVSKMEVDDAVYEPQLSRSQKMKLPKTQSANEAWASLPTIPSSLLPQMKRDYQALALSNSLDPKRFLKGAASSSKNKVPERFAIGTLVNPPRQLQTSTARETPKYRPGQIVDGLVRDQEVGTYAKRKFGELQGKRMENGRGKGWKKRKGGW